MNDLGITIPEDILTLLKKLDSETYGYKLYLGGGYLRDLYKGLAPKDVDLFFIPYNTTVCWYKDFVLPINQMSSSPVYDFTHVSEDMQARGVKRVMCFWEKGLSTKEVNFIEYDHYLVDGDLAADMDMPLNQIMYDVTFAKFIYTERFVKDHADGIIECVHDFSKERMWKRYQRMKDKFPSYTVIGEPEVGIIEKILWSIPSYHPTKGGSFND